MFEVEKIIDKRVNSIDGVDQIEYLVKWQDYPSDENQWKPVEELTFVGDLIEEYERNNIKSKKKKKPTAQITNSKFLKKRTRQSHR